jgi:hypothetical protein
MQDQEQANPVKQSAARFAAAYVAAGVAITLMVPPIFHGRPYAPSYSASHPRDYVLAAALVPAVIAWLIIRRRPSRQEPAYFRGAMLALALVGAGGLALLTISGRLSGLTLQIVQSGRFTTQAEIYVGIGVFGLLASLLFKDGD